MKQKIDIADYDYELPVTRIAQYPVKERDSAKLLLYNGSNISSDIFRNIGTYINENSLLVFNNSRVIKARLLFKKKSGSLIEILCLEPLSPVLFEKSFTSNDPVEWKCMVGNLKKWKTKTITTEFTIGRMKYVLCAERVGTDKDTCRIIFSWNSRNLTFSDVIEASGHVPLPPYITRGDEKADISRYQTVYSLVKGSVAAPTAGLHFTKNLINKISEKDIKMCEITLHIGLGTFQPVKAKYISDHNMHSEYFSATKETITKLREHHGRIIAVGTTSVRTLESLYWLGVKTIKDKQSNIDKMHVCQWESYQYDPEISVRESLTALLDLMDKNRCNEINASTQLVIVPGFQFRMIEGLITNFHQPRSTLLLLISAWTGPVWREIYKYAIRNEFRFLSYGDSSFLYKSPVKSLS